MLGYTESYIANNHTQGMVSRNVGPSGADPRSHSPREEDLQVDTCDIIVIYLIGF